MSTKRNPYQVLGVERTATDADIKKAYRKLAMKCHPDRNPSPEAQSEFQELDEAFKLIETEDARFAFDQGITPKTTEEIQDVVLRSMQAAIEENTLDGVLPRLRLFIKKEKESKTNKIAKLEKKLARLKRNRKRMIVVGDGRPNLFERAVDMSIDATQLDLANERNDLDMLTKFHAELEFYQEGPVVHDPVEATTTVTYVLGHNVGTLPR